MADDTPAPADDGAASGAPASVTRLVRAGGAGLAAWLAGLLVTLLVVQAVGFGGDAGGGGAEVDTSDGDDLSVLGLVFLGAHHVDTEPRPALTDGFNFVAELAATVDPLYRLLFLVPPLSLVLAGAALVAVDGSGLAGPGVVVGYLPPSALGAALFVVEVDAGPVSVALTAPAATAVVLAGTVHPLVFGAVGSLLAQALGLDPDSELGPADG